MKADKCGSNPMRRRSPIWVEGAAVTARPEEAMRAEETRRMERVEAGDGSKSDVSVRECELSFGVVLAKAAHTS
jgi:hypothetical protein